MDFDFSFTFSYQLKVDLLFSRKIWTNELEFLENLG